MSSVASDMSSVATPPFFPRSSSITFLPTKRRRRPAACQYYYRPDRCWQHRPKNSARATAAAFSIRACGCDARTPRVSDSSAHAVVVVISY